MRIKLPRRLYGTRSAVLALLAICLLQAPAAAQEATEQVLTWPSFGLAPGQSLRFTLFVPGDMPVRGHTKVFDNTGMVVAESARIKIPAGHFHSFDFGPDELRRQGSPAAGRDQLHASCYVRVSGAWQKVDGLA